jgi:acyl-CoA thioester hydrolase
MSGRFTIRFPVRFRDVDAIGHVNNAVYFTYMEQARTEYWMQLFGLESLGQISFIVAHAECDFEQPAHFGHELEVTIRTSAIGNTSFVWEYEIRNAETSELFARGKTIQVYYDYSQRKKLPVPSDVRSKLLS